MKKTSLSRRLRRISGLLVFLAGWTAASGQTIYVDADAPGDANGTSWENAYNFLQDALDEARTTGMDIWVAQGVYTPDSNSAAPGGTGDREASFELIGSNVTIRGGYAGFGASDPNARDAGSYETILSGDLGHNDGPDFTNYDENSYHVVLAIWTTATIDGFTITAGNATGTGGFTLDAGFYVLEVGRDSGGGVYSSYYCSATFANCIFDKNKATWGAGMYNNGDWGNAILMNCVFSNNTAFGGGGMFTGGLRNFFLDLECAPKLTNCTFEGNSADLGGGMYSGEWFKSKPILENCNFTRNTATFSGGAIHNNGGSLALTGCDFVGNSTLIGGGLVGGGAVYSLNATPLNITNCIFSGNASAAVGGAVYAGSCQSGAGTCGGSGGGRIDTSTFVGNKAADSGGAVCWSIGKSAMANCILWGNIAPEGKEMAVDPHNNETVISYSDVEGGAAGVFYIDPDCRSRERCQGDPNCNPCSLDWGLSNLDADPCFADPGYWDTNGTPDDATDDFWVNGDYHLKSETGRWDPNLMSWVQDYVTSPCIDAGAGLNYVELPPHSGYTNMGAYGGTAEASKACFARSSCGILIEGDLNGDCLVNGTDLAIMARNWGILTSSSAWCDAFLAGQMDYNRMIDFRDLLVIAQHWCDEN